MDTDARSINEIPIHPRPVIVPPSLNAPVPLMPAIKPLELWAFLENSDFLRLKNGSPYRQDEVNLIRHDEFLEADYRLMVQAGCLGIRDAARWYLSHPAPGVFDWSWLDRVVDAAKKHNLKLYLDLWHYGYPDWLDILSADAPLRGTIRPP